MILSNLIDRILFPFIQEPELKDESIYQIATIRVKTIEPKRPSCYLAWVRFMQRYNKTIIKL
jgi:hypothetical protein